jgi:transglycosylase-like protein with SLT domain
VYRWRTARDGGVDVDTGDGRGYQRVRVQGDPMGLALTARWTELAQRVGARHRWPAHWLLGAIYAESRGRPDSIEAHEPGAPHGVGLLQLTSAEARGGLSDAELVDPATNLEFGTRYWAAIARGLELPQAASVYNAGPNPHPPPRWRVGAGSLWSPLPGLAHSPGLRATDDHIERVVRASNTFLDRLPHGAGDAALAVLAAGALLLWWQA